MSSITIEKLYKRYGDIETVHGIDLSINSGEFVVFVGPSGCGKSTILRMIAGLEVVSDGHIKIGDRIVNEVAPKDRNVAMVFQNYALYPHKNVFENMCFALQLQKISKDQIQLKVQDAAEILGLEMLLERKPHELSGGQRQRVAMGRALVRSPDVFLFDEPLSNLDAKLRNQMRAEIKKIHQQTQTTIVYVTHDQLEAMTLADRIVVLKDGYVEQVGTPLELYSKPQNKFVAGFIGNPPMNIIDGFFDNAVCFSENQTRLELGDNLLTNNQKLCVGFRPEQITLQKTSDNALPFKGQVDLIEPLGASALVHMKMGTQKIVADVKENLPKVGDDVQFYVPETQVHLFNEQGNQRLSQN